MRNFLILFIFLIPLAGFSQTFSERFGKNRLQYKDFDWKYLSTENFEVYYYNDNKLLAENAAFFAEQHFPFITKVTGFYPYNKLKLVIYESVADMQQSNIHLDDAGQYIGGHTDFIKSRIEIPFKGRNDLFEEEILEGVSRTLIEMMMYGGSFKDVVQSSYFLSLQEWYVSGLAKYLAKGWDVEMDSYIRNLALSDQLKSPEVYEGKDAAVVGQSVWNYIATRYGKDRIGDILNYTRIVKSDVSSIETNLSMYYGRFLRQWRTFYQQNALDLEDHYALPGGEDMFRKAAGDRVYDQVKISPDSRYTAATGNNNGKYKVFVSDEENGKRKTVYRGGFKEVNESFSHLRFPVITWKNKMVLSIADIKKGDLILTEYNVETRKKVKRDIPQLDLVHSMSYSPDGSYLLISGVKNGQNDLFVWDMKNSMRQITNDVYDDIHPAFVPGSFDFFFVSNRINDTLQGRGDLVNTGTNFKLYKYNVFTPSPVLQKFTSGGNSFYPVVTADNEVLFLNDEEGIRNVYRVASDSTRPEPVTNSIFNISTFDYNDEKGLVYLAQGKSASPQIKLLEDFAPSPVDIISTRRVEEMEKKLIQDIVDQKKADEKTDSSDTTTSDEININYYIFESDLEKEKEKPSKAAKPAFEPDNVKYDSRSDFVAEGPEDYRRQFSVNNIITSLRVDPFRDLGVYMRVNMSDLLNNHRMSAGIFGLTDLKSSNIFAEYEYLKKRVDIKAGFERQTFFAYDDFAAHRYTLNTFELTGAYPLSYIDRISGTAFIAHTRYSNIHQAFISSPDSTDLYVGTRAEYVFDNTVVEGLNRINGFRGKAGIESYFHTLSSEKNFHKLYLDVRNYQKFLKHFTFATRLAYGQFIGRGKKDFMLGGMDNWMFNRTSYTGEGNPLTLQQNTANSDLLFVEYVTSMRGFPYNTQYGNKFFLFNAEIRMPLAGLFFDENVTSGFFKNLQLVSFTDFGSAWSGKNPFSKDNSLNKEEITSGGGPFSATVINYKDPFLWGYGVGARTLFLGYYVKLDVAWGVKDKKVQDRMVYFTFGFDF